MANLSGGGCNLNEKGCSKRTDKKLDTFDWLCDIPESQSATDLVEVTFKNTPMVLVWKRAISWLSSLLLGMILVPSR